MKTGSIRISRLHWIAWTLSRLNRHGDRWYKRSSGVIPKLWRIPMISTNKPKFTRLVPYMEAIGPFTGLEEQNGTLLAEIAKHIVVLPIELKDVLTPHLGGRIAILRTDIPAKEYLFRVLTERDRVKTAAMDDQGFVEDELEVSLKIAVSKC